MEVEEEKFVQRLDTLLPLLEREIHPDNYEDVSRCPPSLSPPLPPSSLRCLLRQGEGGVLTLLFVSQIEEEQEEKGADRLLFSHLTLVTKLVQHCGLLELQKPRDTLLSIWGKELAQNCSLGYRHRLHFLTSVTFSALRSHRSPPELPSLLGVADRLAALWSAVRGAAGGAAGQQVERRGCRCFSSVRGHRLHHHQPGQEGRSEDHAGLFHLCLSVLTASSSVL